MAVFTHESIKKEEWSLLALSLSLSACLCLRLRLCLCLCLCTCSSYACVSVPQHVVPLVLPACIHKLSPGAVSSYYYGVLDDGVTARVANS